MDCLHPSAVAIRFSQVDRLCCLIIAWYQFVIDCALPPLEGNVESILDYINLPAFFWDPGT